MVAWHEVPGNLPIEATSRRRRCDHAAFLDRRAAGDERCLASDAFLVFGPADSFLVQICRSNTRKEREARYEELRQAAAF